MAPTNFVALSVLEIWLFLTNACNGVMPKAHRSLLFPAILIFGDSTVDTGNNNYIPTLFKANYYPYGRDFPGQIPTGRFSDGKLIPDLMASALGIKELVPPFLDPMLSDDELRTGVSFASSGSGYDELTTVTSGVIPVMKQIDLFKNYSRRLERIVGQEEVKKIINGALVVVSAGSNDFIISFYDIPSRSVEFNFNISSYQDFLQNRLQSFIKQLYELGCRNIIVAGLPPIGCLPIQETAAFEDPKNRKCLETQNSDSQMYNQKLTSKLRSLQAQLAGSKILYADVYSPVMDMINQPLKYGMEETKRGCCGSGLAEAGPLCNPGTPTCKEPGKYLFWDSIHPTESAYRYIANSVMKQLGAYYPIQSRN